MSFEEFQDGRHLGYWNGTILAIQDTSSGPVLHFYQVSSKYSKGYLNYRADNKFYTNADSDAN